MFTARWKKEAKLLYKGAKKFLNYKRDLLEEEKISAIEEARSELLQSIKSGDRDKVKAAEKQVTQACEGALPRYRRPNAIEENIEVFFVAIVIALGIRAYYLQPFRIPTGSMQPTLNGIVGHKLAKEDFPSLPVKAVQAVTGGRKYINRKLTGNAPRLLRNDPERVDQNRQPIPWITEGQKWHFFSYTTFHFEDGIVKVNAPRSALENMGLVKDSIVRHGHGANVKDAQGRVFSDAEAGRFYVAPNTTISGYTTSGDLVLVDKLSYNFRRPKRGEVFVFDTRGITGIQERSDNPQGAGSHYIKRLVGVPGDTLQIGGSDKLVGNDLIINGNPASEEKIHAVMKREGRYAGDTRKGYLLAEIERGRSWKRALDDTDDVLSLKTRAQNMEAGKTPIEALQFREYAAMGDHTDNSLDSRYWGAVREYNLVGPALISLWPFSSGHWGLIK